MMIQVVLIRQKMQLGSSAEIRKQGPIQNLIGKIKGLAHFSLFFRQSQILLLFFLKARDDGCDHGSSDSSSTLKHHNFNPLESFLLANDLLLEKHFAQQYDLLFNFCCWF